MAEQDDKQRDRSPNFPFIALEPALGRARAFYDEERRGSAAISVIAKHWDYSAKSSGLVQTVAALKSYGLMDDEGRGPLRRVRLSDMALRILLDQRPNSLERLELLRQAAMTPYVACRILEKFTNDAPSDSNLEHFLIFDLKFLPDAAKAAVRIFKDNAVFTGIYDSGTISPSSGTNGEYMEPVIQSAAVNTGGQTPRLTINRVKTERIIGPDGDILIQFESEPSWRSYDFLEEYVKLRKKVLNTGAPSGNEEKDKK